MAATVQWVECSRCEKWRIIPARADGRHEEIPDLWFCDMNTDLTRNFCEAEEQEYVEPTVVVKRLPKSNDPEAVRARLKGMTLIELQAAFDSFDIDQVLRLEFGSDLIAAKSLQLVVNQAGEKRKHHKMGASLMKEATELLPRHISNQFTR